MSQFRQHINLALTVALLIGAVWQTFTVVNFYMNQEEIIEAHYINQDKPDLNAKEQDYLKEQLSDTIPEQETTKSGESSEVSVLLFV
jgi:hypothetical protein